MYTPSVVMMSVIEVLKLTIKIDMAKVALKVLEDILDISGLTILFKSFSITSIHVLHHHWNLHDFSAIKENTQTGCYNTMFRREVSSLWEYLG